MVKDDLFGQIEWTEDVWETSLPASYFRGSGARVQLTADDRADLPSEGQLPLKIETGESRRRPSDTQRNAWKKITQRGDAMWDEVMEALCAEYRIQRSNRERYWKVLRGDKLISRNLPAAVDKTVMKELVLPLWCHVQEPSEENELVDVYLTLLATWWSESINVYIRDGRVIEVGALGGLMSRNMPATHTEAFGRLRRRAGNKQLWVGEVGLEPFRTFAAVSVDRSSWDESYTRSDEGTSDLPWNVARGVASLRVYGPLGKPPAAGQAVVFADFMKQQDANASIIIQALFAHYEQTASARRKEYRASNRDAAVPALKDAKGLQDLTELSEVNVFPQEGSNPIAIGLVFRGSWTGPKGVGLRWRDGKVEQIKDADVATPKPAR